MDSNISFGPASLAVTADSLAGLPMVAGLAGRPRLIFRTLLQWGTLDVDSNGNLFLGGEGNTFYLYSFQQRADRKPDADV